MRNATQTQLKSQLSGGDLALQPRRPKLNPCRPHFLFSLLSSLPRCKSHVLLQIARFFIGSLFDFIFVFMKKRRFTGIIAVRLLTGLLSWTGPVEALVRSFTGWTAGPVWFK
jgi:hypothetical protein